MRISLAIAVCLLASLQANSESIDFAIYQRSGEERALITQGRLDYTFDDIDVTRWGWKPGHQSWKKSLKIKKGFGIDILVTPDDALSGFGLVITNGYHPEGFSWEWFLLEDGDVFKKLQGEGRVRVTQAQTADGKELQSVEFLTDVTMRFQDDMKLPPGTVTHEVVVLQGSVFRFAP